MGNGEQIGWVDGSGFGRIRWRVGFGRILGGVHSGDESIVTSVLDNFGRFWAILDELGLFWAILASGLKWSSKWIPDSDGVGRESDSDGFGRIPGPQIWNAATQQIGDYLRVGSLNNVPTQVRTTVVPEVPSAQRGDVRRFWAVLIKFGRFQRRYAPKTYLDSRFQARYGTL